MREPEWRKAGKTPDYRFSLANERTFLAWIRTSLALLAGAVAIDQLAPDIAPQAVRIALCVVLALVGAGLAFMAYRRWGLMEAAMRDDQALPFSRILLFMTIVVAVAAFVFAVLILVAR